MAPDLNVLIVLMCLIVLIVLIVLIFLIVLLKFHDIIEQSGDALVGNDDDNFPLRIFLNEIQNIFGQLDIKIGSNFV